MYSGGSGDFILLERGSFHALRGFNELYRLTRVGIDLNFLVKAYSSGFRIVDIGAAVYHTAHVDSFRTSKSVMPDEIDPSWGVRWSARSVIYENPESWGLRDAPQREIETGVTRLEFSCRSCHREDQTEDEKHGYGRRDTDDDRLRQESITEQHLSKGAQRFLQRGAEIPEVAQRQIAGQQLARIGQMLVVVVACGAHQNGFVHTRDHRDDNTGNVIARVGFDAHQAWPAKQGIIGAV